jgi:hypothetical protein
VKMNYNEKIVLMVYRIIEMIEDNKIFRKSKVIKKNQKRLKRYSGKIEEKKNSEDYGKVVKVIVYILLKIIFILVVVALLLRISITFIKENNKKVSELDDKEKKLTKQEAKELLGIIEVLDEIYNYK